MLCSNNFKTAMFKMKQISSLSIYCIFCIYFDIFRHTFREFVERYRNLINGCPPAHKVIIASE